ncbi:glycosyl hydrolase 115 family protein [Butyrivibrio sp. AD3002]|uniref:glycosyl hydrolase 115 family protein n=1 Tax=Butyrivibrio sp. AD3002 TaxID=1280670 RepID=UPI0003B32152|nr:glycosyl hydrolase 115 family protein [Butyrivibrio sp. AD3002]
MDKFTIFSNNIPATFLIEEESFEGIKLIGKTVAEDIQSVTGIMPEIIRGILDMQAENVSESSCENIILMATCGHSPVLDSLESLGKITTKDIEGKREVYKISLVDEPFPENGHVKQMLVIAGSDKRGTIYGMFRLSEMCGVSPLIYFGDVTPLKKNEIILKLDKEIVSKEPSVRYRGFFINDEWPAFGNWATEKFGDVNAKCYRKIFELLLRLKGNYMWPAMWNSNFSEDGPGLLSAELADKLGVVMGLSHHEPMCRAGNEWQQQYKKYSDDNTWSFLSNEEGITKFWEDGINRNKAFENVITIGMRGEADSKLMPEDATLSDNIRVIKKAIKTQDDLIRRNVNEDISMVPRMLAIYKEVEDYYFGDEYTEGLKDWDELKDVIFLLSDDNHGHVRALPTDDTRNHPGGFGMYYHFDYHGAPVSYEWVNCTRLTKTWEQMSLAYESGVRQMWIVNVGDLKLNEYPLSFFMDMAYDYEKYGEKSVNKIEEYVYGWINRQFPGVSDEQKKDIAKVLEGYTRFNAQRTPETMNPDVYHPVNFMEGDRVWRDARDILDTADRLNRELRDEALIAYRSMIYYQAAASLNNVLMNVEAGMNRELALRGCVYANHYAESVRKRIEEDIRYVNEFHEFNDCKWKHMMSSDHTNFRSWDAYNWTYPTVSVVSPIHGPKAAVSFRGEKIVNYGAHWQCPPAPVSYGFTRPETTEVFLDIDSRGDVSYVYEIENDIDWLICKNAKGRVEVSRSRVANFIAEDANGTSSDGRKTVCFAKRGELITGKIEAKAKVKISFDDGTFTDVDIIFKADKENYPDGYSRENLYMEKCGIITVNAECFHEKKDVRGVGFKVVDYLGKSGKPAIKVFPSTSNFDKKEILDGRAPLVKYNVLVEDDGVYTLDFHLAMTNPIVKGGLLKFGYAVNESEIIIENALKDGYFTDFPCRQWCDDVLSHEHTKSVKVSLHKGINTIALYAGDAGAVFDKLVLCREDVILPKTYLYRQ